MKLSNRQIGAVGVTRVASALMRLGYSVLIPVEDYCGYDLVAEKRNRFIRIQVKTSERKDPTRNRYCFMTCRGAGEKAIYRGGLDAFILWGMEDDLFWVVNPSKCKTKSYKATLKTGSSWRILSDL